MSDQKCVSAEFVLEDGRVMRWEDDEADDVFHDEANDPMLLERATHPLRFVSWTPCGRYFDGDDVNPQGIEDDEGQVEPFRKMVPSECVLRRSIGLGPGRGVPLLRGAEGYYRVVVEFVPKEGEKR